MKANIFLFILLLAMGAVTRAQSIYHFKYHMKNESDPTGYDAFFVTKGDGSGTVRIKYNSPANGQAMLLHMDLQQEYPDMASGDLNYNKFNYRLSAPKFIKGSDITNYNVPVFWFKKNTGSGLFEPWGVTSGNTDPAIAINVFELVEYFEKKDLTKDLVLNYFVPQDDFYVNLFVNKTRGLTPTEKDTRLILLAVVNVNDPEIGSSCAKDLQRANETFRKLSMMLGIRMDSIFISGNNYNKENVEKALDELKPAPNDIIVFYYSGHGFRKPKDGRQFPYMDLRPKVDDTYMVNSLNVEDVYTSIRKKGARFNLVLTDCCNTNVESINAKGVAPPEAKGLGLDWYIENARTLFLDPIPISILATAADVDQKASSNDNFGGFFSFYMRQSIEDQLGFFNKKVSWENIRDNATKQTVNKAQHTYCDKPYIPENICDQTPVFRIIRGN